MQFVVIGAGNIGAVYGGNLARTGQDVAFVDVWPEHVDRINRDGLRLEGLSGDFEVRVLAVTNFQKAPKADAVLICVNAYSTAGAGAAARCLLKEEGFCLTLQNGVGNIEAIQEAVGPNRVLAGLSFMSGDLAGPGVVRHTNAGPTYLGELDRSRSARLQWLNDRFALAGLNPVLVEDIVETIWAKFVHNCGINAICAVTGLRPSQIHAVKDLDEFQSKIIEEAVALVRAKGHALTGADEVSKIKEYCAHKSHRPSMMQHLDRGKQTEIDSLNGYVARESKRLGLAAPYNDALTSLVRGREFRPSISGEDV